MRRSLPNSLSLACAGTAASVVAFAGPSTDDSFITLHFARSLVNGKGLTFNPHEPVEGFTSPLHLLVSAGTYLLPGAEFQLVKLKVASAVFALGSLIVFRRLVGLLDLPRKTQDVALAAGALSAVFGVAATNGLETSLAMLLTTWLALEALRRTSPARVGLASAACILTRPDAVPVVVAIWLALLLSERRHLMSRSWLWGALVGATPVLLYEGFRLAYFGQLLPNTYYAKHMSLIRSIRPGAEYFVHALIPEFPSRWPVGPGDWFVAAVGLGIALWIAMLLAFGSRKLVRSGQSPVVAAVAAQVSVCLFTGGESIGLRFVAPIWLLFCATIACGVNAVAAAAAPKLATNIAVAMSLICIGAALALQWEAGRVAPIWTLNAFDDPSVLSRGRETGFGALWANSPSLLECAPKGSSVAYSEMGYAFWERRDLRVTDVRGLVDEKVAHGAPSELHTIVGVVDPRWAGGSSFIGRILSERRPALILSIEPDQSADALAGRYVREFERNFGDVTVTGYRRSDVACP